MSEFCKIRVLLFDNHPVIRQALSTILGLQSDIDLVGEASDGEAAVRLCRKIVPDVMLVGVSLADMGELETIQLIHTEFPNIRIIGLPMDDIDAFTRQIIEAGASVCCTKGCVTDVLLSAIRAK